MFLELEDIHKSFADKNVLNGISMNIEQGRIFALLGPSGCGKTTLLRIIAGLEKPDQGSLCLESLDLADIPIHKRGFGLVFQDFALFPHKNVAQNVEFGLRMLGMEDDFRQKRVREALSLVGLSGFENRSVYSLSGGEQQRVGLARSLAPSPRLLLLDEPLGSLDRALRERLMIELRAILKQAGGVMGRPEGITVVYVTHDQEEAFAIADQIAVMNAGQIEQLGNPIDLYNRPASVFVARFLGMNNILPANVVNHDPLIVATAIGEFRLSEFGDSSKVDKYLLIRPDAGRIVIGNEADNNKLSGRVENISFRGRSQIVSILVEETGGEEQIIKLEFDADNHIPQIGEPVQLFLDPGRLMILDNLNG